MKMDRSILKWDRRNTKKDNHFLKKGLSSMKKKHTFLRIQSCCLKKYAVSASSLLPLQMILSRYHRMTNGATGYIGLFFKEDKKNHILNPFLIDVMDR